MSYHDFLEQWSNAIDVSALRPESALQSIPQWDSLAVLTTIAMADAEFDVQLTAQQLIECKTVENVFQLIQPITQKA